MRRNRKKIIGQGYPVWSPRKTILTHGIPFIVAISLALVFTFVVSHFQIKHAESIEHLRNRLHLITQLWMDLLEAEDPLVVYVSNRDDLQLKKYQDIHWMIEADLLTVKEQGILPNRVYQVVDSLWQEAHSIAIELFQSTWIQPKEANQQLSLFNSKVKEITNILSTQYKDLNRTLDKSQTEFSNFVGRVTLLKTALLVLAFILVVGLVSSISLKVRKQASKWQEEVLYRSKQHEYLNQLQGTLGSILDLSELMPKLLPPIVEYVGADAGTIAIYDKDREIITYPYHYNLPEGLSGVEVKCGVGIAWVTMQEGEIVALEDYRSHPKSLKPWIEAGVRSIVAVPLKMGEEIVGSLGLFRLNRVLPFTEEQIERAKAVSSLAAVAIHRAKVFEHERNLAKQLKIVSRIAGKVSKILDINRLLQETVEMVVEEYNFFRASILFYEPEREELVIRAVAGYYTDRYSVGRRFKITETGILKWVCQNKKSLRVNDVSEDRRYVRFIPETRSELCVPIIEGERVVGVINIISDKRYFFTEVHKQAMETLASELAVAIKNANLFDELNRKIKELYMLYMVNKEGATILDFDRLAEQVAELLMGHFEADAFFIALYDENKKELDYRILLEGDKRYPRMALPFGKGLTSYVVSTKKPLLIQDWKKERYNFPKPVNIGAGDEIMSWMGTPLMVGDRVLGVISIQAYRTNAFNEDDLNLLTGIASSMAITIKNLELYRESQYQARLLQALHNILLEIPMSSEINRILDLTLKEIMDALEADKGMVFLSQYLSIKGMPMEVGLRIIEILGKDRMQTTLVVRVENCQKEVESKTDLSEFAMVLLEHGVNSVLSAPIKIDDERIGGLVIGSSYSRVWTEEECSLLEAIGKELGEAFRRMELLQRLKTQADRLNSIMESVGEGIVMLDPDYKLVIMNRAADEILKKVAEVSKEGKLTAIAGRPIEEFTKPPPRGQSCHTIELTTPTLQVYEVVMRPLLGGGGWVLVIREVTEEEVLRRQIALQERLATVGQLAAGIAHDFNNILTVIIGTAELLRGSQKITPGMQESLDTIVRQGYQAASLIRQILDFSRKTTSLKEPLLLEPFLKESVKMLRRTIPENINIVLETQPGRHLIEGDPTQIQQMITNLAVNARDAMPKGGELRLTLRDIKVDDQNPPPVTGMPHGEYAELCIIDSGIGIPRENLPRIFEPFFTTKPRGEGTGLGLSQVYGIVTQHDGFIDVKSEVGKGTTFRIYLPLVAKKEKELKETEHKLVKGNKEKVLIVEDNPTVRETLMSMLEKLNYTPIVAESGEGGLELYKKYQEEIICVVSDIVMEGMGGEELFEEIKKINPKVKVVFISGYPLYDKGKELISKGAVGWLQKPVEIEKLSQLIVKTIQSGAKGQV